MTCAKTLIYLTLFFLAGCGQSSKTEVEGADSSAHAAPEPAGRDSVSTFEEEQQLEDDSIDENELDDQQQVNVDEVDARIMALLQEYKEPSEKYPILEVEERDHDAMNKGFWLFNQSGELKYFYESWSVDGGAGTRYCFFNNGELVGIRDEDTEPDGGQFITVAFIGLQGATTSREDDKSDEAVEPVGDDYVVGRRDEFRMRFEQLINQLRKGKAATKDETVVVEAELNYDTDGSNHTSTFKAVLPIKLFKQLVN